MVSTILILITFIFNFIKCVPVNDTDEPFDYCNHPDCSLKNQHTLCAAANKQSPRLFASGITTWMRYQLMLLHNRYRDNVAMGLEAGQPPATNMRKMYWDYELEKMAEVWARQCQKRHDECRNTIRFNVLQNMDVRAVLPGVTEAQLLADAVGSWFSGARILAPENVWSFRRVNCSGAGGCNVHWYTAAAWASTWRVGCSQALCTTRKQSCMTYRKKRRTPPPLKNVDNVTMSSNTVSKDDGNILLRRTRYMMPSKTSRFEDFASSTAKINPGESPLHRGIVGIVNRSAERKRELQILAFTVCNYGPAGNIDGFPMYEAGTTCSNCPMGTECEDRTHRALCSVIGDPDIYPGK